VFAFSSLALGDELAASDAVVALPCNFLAGASYAVHSHTFSSRRYINDVPVFGGAVVCFSDICSLLHFLGIVISLIVVVSDIDSDSFFLSWCWSRTHTASAFDGQSCVSHLQLIALLLVNDRIIVEVFTAGPSWCWWRLWGARAGARMDIDFGVVARGVDIDICLFRA
jgi:hypothetical protein